MDPCINFDSSSKTNSDFTQSRAFINAILTRKALSSSLALVGMLLIHSAMSTEFDRICEEKAFGGLDYHN
jgi:hypothetical protein